MEVVQVEPFNPNSSREKNNKTEDSGKNTKHPYLVFIEDLLSFLEIDLGSYPITLETLGNSKELLIILGYCRFPIIRQTFNWRWIQLNVQYEILRLIVRPTLEELNKRKTRVQRKRDGERYHPARRRKQQK